MRHPLKKEINKVNDLLNSFEYKDFGLNRFFREKKHLVNEVCLTKIITLFQKDCLLKLLKVRKMGERGVLKSFSYNTHM